MILPRHTPGPWVPLVGIEARKAITAAGMVPIYAPNDPTPTYHGIPRREIAFAWVGGVHRPADQIMADALLMAAAPDLLATLRALLARAEGIDGPSHDEILAARAAIAAATPPPP